MVLSSMFYSRVIVSILGVVSLIVCPVNAVKCNSHFSLLANGKQQNSQDPQCEADLCGYVDVELRIPGHVGEGKGGFCIPTQLSGGVMKHSKVQELMDFKTAIVSMNINGQSADILVCKEDDCNTENNSHYKKNKADRKSIANIVDNSKRLEAKDILKCHNDNGESQQCYSGYCVT